MPQKYLAQMENMQFRQRGNLTICCERVGSLLVAKDPEETLQELVDLCFRGALSRKVLRLFGTAGTSESTHTSFWDESSGNRCDR